jgi:TPR repeat protein
MKGVTMQRNNRPLNHDEFAKPKELRELFEAELPIVRVLAEHGHVISQFTMGEAHLRGWGAPPDLSQSAEWYRKAAEQGRTVAQATLGNLYLAAEGVSQDYSLALHWLQKAAQKGDDVA